MRKVTGWIVWIVVAVLIYKAALWTYESYRKADSSAQQQQEVLDVDKECWKDADTGRCFCRSTRTGERLLLSYDECATRAANPR